MAIDAPSTNPRYVFRIARRVQDALSLRVSGGVLARLFVSNLPIALCLAVALVLPDWLMSVISHRSRAIYTPGIFLYILLFCFFVSLVRPWRFVLSLLFLLGILEIIHFCYTAYFGGVIDANIFMEGIVEYEDVIKGGLGVLRHVYYYPLIVLAPYTLAWMIIKRQRWRQVTVPFMWVIVLGAAGIVPYQIVRHGNAVHYYPADAFPSAVNSYLTFSSLLFNHIPKVLFNTGRGDSGVEFSAVSLSDTGAPRRMTIAIIMNESLTFDRMSLFGYERKTTPRLELLKTDRHFVFKRGFSAGIGTRSTFYSFWNGIRDPRNEMEYMKQTTNLFRLAREHGFRTTILSAQRSNLLQGVGTQYVDHLVTFEAAGPLYESLHDEMFEELMRKIEFKEKNFIVLHLRSAHGPYSHNYSTRKALAVYPTGGLNYAAYQQNSYDNAVRYNDFVMSKLLEYFRKTVPGPLYIFMTSDHGQLLGDNQRNLFGHGILLPEVAHVPIMLYEQHGDRGIIESMRRMQRPTHYEMTEFITRLLGFTIRDPNAQDGVYFINGIGYYGQGGYIRVTKGRGKGHGTLFHTVRSGAG